LGVWGRGAQGKKGQLRVISSPRGKESFGTADRPIGDPKNQRRRPQKRKKRERPSLEPKPNGGGKMQDQVMGEAPEVFPPPCNGKCRKRGEKLKPPGLIQDTVSRSTQVKLEDYQNKKKKKGKKRKKDPPRKREPTWVRVNENERPVFTKGVKKPVGKRGELPKVPWGRGERNLFTMCRKLSRRGGRENTLFSRRREKLWTNWGKWGERNIRARVPKTANPNGEKKKPGEKGGQRGGKLLGGERGSGGKTRRAKPDFTLLYKQKVGANARLNGKEEGSRKR